MTIAAGAMHPQARPTLALIGGTGALGSGLAWRWSCAGYPVLIGSRDAERAVAAAEALRQRVAGAADATGQAAGEPIVQGMTNRAAAAGADVAVVTVPYASHAEILTDIREAVAGRLVVDCTVPLRPPKVGTVALPAAGSAAVEARALLGTDTTLVSAFHNVAAHKLAEDRPIDCDVLVFGDDKAARTTVITLVEALGLRGWHGGPLANAAAAEALTSVLITINRQHKIDGAGLRITGAPVAG